MRSWNLTFLNVAATIFRFFDSDVACNNTILDSAEKFSFTANSDMIADQEKLFIIIPTDRPKELINRMFVIVVITKFLNNCIYSS